MANMDDEHKKAGFFQNIPPKTSFFFGMITATAILSVVGLIVLLPLSLKSSSKGTVAGAQVPTPSAQGAGGTQAATADISKVNVKDSRSIGDANAPVVMAYWTDYQCPFCQRFDQQTLTTLVEQYVNKGKLKIVVKDFAFLGDDSTTAGLAARAVWEVSPKNYLAWHEAVFSKQDGENTGWGNKDDIIELTKTISGINADKVAKLMDQKKDEYLKAMNADKSEGSGFGVTGTPGFVIGTQLISGAVPTSDFTTAIEAELAKK